MIKYLVVFEECGSDEVYLERTKTAAVERIQQIQVDYGEDDEAMAASVTIYEVTKSFKYNPPVQAAGLIETSL